VTDGNEMFGYCGSLSLSQTKIFHAAAVAVAIAEWLHQW